MSEPSSSIHLQVNGEGHVAPAGQTLPDLLVSLGLPPQTALVEHNGHALLRTEWEGLSLAEGDRLEILRVVAGG